MSCDNLCTAAKCEELENRISALEQGLELIQASFEAHTGQDIPEAHNYQQPEPEISIDLIVNRVLIQIRPTLQIIIDDLNSHIGSDYTIVHNYKNHKSNLSIDGSFASETLYLTVADGESQDTATISIPLPKIPEIPEANVNVEADIYDGTLIIDVTVGDRNGFATVDLPEVEEHVKSNLKLNGSFQEEILILTVADGESQDTASILIPLPKIPEIPEANVNVEADIYDGTLIIDVIVGDRHDFATVDLPEVEQQVKSNLKLNGSFQNDNLTLTVADGESQDTVVINIPTRNGGGGGIDFDACSIDLIYENNLLTANLSVGQCSSSDSTKIMEFAPINVEQITCIDGVAESEIVTVAVIKGTEAAELEAYAARASIQKLQCEACSDVVSIVASPKYVTNVDGKVLILHLVTLNNYPKRARGSNYRQIQIPGAKETYNWENDFENLVWQQGNQYAELELNEYRARVSGWFANEVAANTFFDKVLTLTIGTEKNRRYPKQKYPRTDIANQATRPYRAFIESINTQGQAICHVKYVPPIEPS